eukprot:Nk52_evm4s359 gene=Nk52_evmTU4s359
MARRRGHFEGGIYLLLVLLLLKVPYCTCSSEAKSGLAEVLGGMFPRPSLENQHRSEQISLFPTLDAFDNAATKTGLDQETFSFAAKDGRRIAKEARLRGFNLAEQYIQVDEMIPKNAMLFLPGDRCSEEDDPLAVGFLIHGQKKNRLAVNPLSVEIIPFNLGGSEEEEVVPEEAALKLAVEEKGDGLFTYSVSMDFIQTYIPNPDYRHVSSVAFELYLQYHTSEFIESSFRTHLYDFEEEDLKFVGGFQKESSILKQRGDVSFAKQFVSISGDFPLSSIELQGDLRFLKESGKDAAIWLKAVHLGHKESAVFDGIGEDQVMYFYVAFHAVVILLLVLDLWVLGNSNRASSPNGMRRAFIQSLWYIVGALCFAAALYNLRGKRIALTWLGSYCLEKFLSVDNLFVFVTIFSSFKVTAKAQRRILSFGIMGAVVLRALFIVAGVALIRRFEYLLILFGLFLIYTGVKMFFAEEESAESSPVEVFADGKQMTIPTTEEDKGVIRYLRYFVTIQRANDVNDESFFVRLNSGEENLSGSVVTGQSFGYSTGTKGLSSSNSSSGRVTFGRPQTASEHPNTSNLCGLVCKFLPCGAFAVTPLFVVLLIVEVTDMVFALDSIPAILSLTTDPFVAYTSNIFAILGLRALYFCLASAMNVFKYLPTALSFILVFIGVKMELAFIGYHISLYWALTTVFVTLTIAICLSIVENRKQQAKANSIMGRYEA